MAADLTEDARAAVARVLLDELVNDWIIQRSEATSDELRAGAKTREELIDYLAIRLGINTAHLHLDAVYEMRDRLARAEDR